MFVCDECHKVATEMAGRQAHILPMSYGPCEQCHRPSSCFDCGCDGGDWPKARDEAAMASMMLMGRRQLVGMLTEELALPMQQRDRKKVYLLRRVLRDKRIETKAEIRSRPRA